MGVNDAKPSPPNFQCDLRFLQGVDDGTCLHLSLEWLLVDDTGYALRLGLDGRSEKESNPGCWEREWEDGCYVPEREARALHAWLGFLLSQLDAGVLIRKPDA